MEFNENKATKQQDDRLVIWSSIGLIVSLITVIVLRSPERKAASVGSIDSENPVRQLPVRSLNWVESRNALLHIGDLVATSETQEGDLKLGEGTVHLSADTSAEIVRSQEGGVELLIHRGTAKSDGRVAVRHETELAPFGQPGNSMLAMPRLWGR